MNRRSLLITAAGLALSPLMGGCRGANNATLQIRLLENSVPAQLLQEFQRRTEAGRVSFSASPQLMDLFNLLQTWSQPQPDPNPSPFNLPLRSPQPTRRADLVTLGDYWLSAAIQQQLIQPLSLDALAGWEQIPPRWQQLVQRDQQGQLSPDGERWAAPYRWGSLVIAYNVEAFEPLGWTPTNWEDLWRPELQGHLSLLDSARSVIGLTLKKLGQSVNASDLAAIPTLATELAALQRQVKFYGSEDYLQPLLLGDSWAAVGWSTEVLPVLKRDRRIAAVVPTSGTILTSDLWVRPATVAGSAPPELNRWLEFCWQPAVAAQLSSLSLAASPILVTRDRSQLPAAVQANSVLLPPAEVLERSEFLLPVPTEDYRRLWETMRRMG
ncbi:MAG: extracellular solute-binding protein [Cyanobacteria bacterium RM1_2_2]|nr:extracellular solute-binding protein [Cyanobacteria bacterium RM1_2_2]